MLHALINACTQSDSQKKKIICLKMFITALVIFKFVKQLKPPTMWKCLWIMAHLVTYYSAAIKMTDKETVLMGKVFMLNESKNNKKFDTYCWNNELLEGGDFTLIHLQTPSLEQWPYRMVLNKCLLNKWTVRSSFFVCSSKNWKDIRKMN